ncbi:probable DNA-directed RNA polymerase subunit delta [Homarus americanus]|uniref:probable DNA-directed RNA polymerase subunit delta n=2 Tax=Homarus americanus TaxID=6706 RepID=UPI001C48D7A7|nr:probable DNA-directed RNA polymerase subunit delta [Homarus americanus]XP_042215512.1 probable DNA-directed RNA polymerase subunit delta [Homarus americanus]
MTDTLSGSLKRKWSEDLSDEGEEAEKRPCLDGTGLMDSPEHEKVKELDDTDESEDDVSPESDEDFYGEMLEYEFLDSSVSSDDVDGWYKSDESDGSESDESEGSESDESEESAWE